jgi:hypothetical protein
MVPDAPPTIYAALAERLNAARAAPASNFANVVIKILQV